MLRTDHNPIRLPDSSGHPQSVGFPPNHPPMKSFLAVPVTVREQVVAVINVKGMEPDAFDDSDVETLETLADQLAVAVENIQLHRQQRDQSRSLAVGFFRDCIGRDLHDGVIQSIYAAGPTRSRRKLDCVSTRLSAA